MQAVCVLVVDIQCTSSCVLICALASINVLTISTWPSNEAVISGVQPFCMNNVVIYGILVIVCVLWFNQVYIYGISIYFWIEEAGNISHPYSKCDSEGARGFGAREMQETKATL